MAFTHFEQTIKGRRHFLNNLERTVGIFNKVNREICFLKMQWYSLMYLRSMFETLFVESIPPKQWLVWALFIRKYTSRFTKLSSTYTWTWADRADAVSFFPMLFNVEICLSGHRLTLIVAPILGCRDNDDNLEDLDHQEDYLDF